MCSRGASAAGSWGATWTATPDAAIHAGIEVSSEHEEAWAGDVLYAMFAVGKNFRCHCTVTLQNVKADLSALNTSNTLTLVVSDGKGNTQSLVATDAVLVGSTHSQPRGTGTQVLEMECGTADGTTAPLSKGA